ncbi:MULTISPECIES: hypothetical protein [Azospirillum]|uniref:Uncharacterized protein n=2 Tax=Azospirillum brasilense TaxID=192 RepID=A0ABU4P8R9_AZOBR|nr:MULTISPECIES: hypothetical protein [Azospirillum]ALJ36625.1 hypothetical protein AMK58_13885 [Azospirillum brasilense]ALJ37993.1 hypothetical protein AMK58_21610 [Azospirillum brasilense]MDW7557598.1 hypothetical protein [Azospirillum brasilense]MDW7595426.1 hypothetical protein [Azospirillum brasilense]MDW7630097.1 hypothetical protein [Azospirillum brasilense]
MDIRSVSGIQANRPTPASAAPTPQSVADAAAPTSQTASSVADQSTSAASPSDPVVVAGGYISPVLRYDQGARLAVIYFRDRSSGETQNQIPAQQVVEEYRRTASRLSVATGATAEGPGTGKGGVASSGTATPDGAGRSAGPGFDPPTSSGAPSSGTPPATGAGPTGTAPAAVPRAAGSYGAGSPGAIVSVTV